MKNINEPVPVQADVDIEDMNIAQLTALVETFAREYGVDAADVRFSVDHCDYAVYLKCLRPPTAEELAKRQAAAERQKERNRKLKEAKDAKERKEYERLAKKYGAA